MTIMVTGGAGFLGCHVASALHRAGHDFAVLDVNNTPPALQDAGIRWQGWFADVGR
jgi:nucleoside-diphosphate-sugar epimerase